ncbi:hypothetical protein B2A_01351 [mine drainage metagenome]|uniref:Antitoxin n=1 Tax=mine drainage metagenome TaxID=410659 RepID=T1BBX6_9ZZZZ
MVKAIVTITEDTNRVLNIIKAEYDLKDKSEAINVMAKEYKELVFEPRVKPSYLRKLKKIQKESLANVGTLKDFRKRYNLD